MATDLTQAPAGAKAPDLQPPPSRTGRRRSLRIDLLVALIGARLIAGSVVATYPRFRSEMNEARKELKAGSSIIQTAAGPIEYAEVGAHRPWERRGVRPRTHHWENLRRLRLSPDRAITFGYLQSPLAANNGSPIAQADAYAALLDARSIEGAAVVAVSDGGPSALQFTIRHPERSTALVMMSAKSKTPPQESKVQKLVFSTIFRSDYLYWLITERFESSLLSIYGMPKEVQQNLETDQKDFVGGFLKTMHPMGLRKADVYNDREELSRLPSEVFTLERISTPALIIHGKLDSLQRMRSTPLRPSPAHV